MASHSPQGMIPWRVNLPGVSYPGESIKNPPKHDSPSPVYHTPASQSPRGITPQRVSFFKPKILITQRNLYKNQKYFYPLVSGIGRFE